MDLTPAIEARALYRFFHTGDDEIAALRDVTLAVTAGQLVALRGPSGSGKSTLLACLAGLDEPDAGMVRINDEQLTRRSERRRAELRARSVGVLYQSGNLIGHLNVGQNIDAARRVVKRRADGPTVHDLLRDVGLNGREGTMPTQLSGGEAARAGLAVALANQPQILLADEPTGELDADAATDVLWLLRAHADGGRAVVIATHSTAVAGIADRVIELTDGRVTG